MTHQATLPCMAMLRGALIILYLFNISVAFDLKHSVSRRDAIFSGAAGGLTFLWSASTKPCFAQLDEQVSSSSLIALIPRMAFGAPATNATIPPNLSSKIEAMTATLETQSNMNNLAKSPILSGSWRLLYSNGLEITKLAGGLPLGFTLGPTYQPLDTASGRFENRGNVVNRFINLAKLQTNVIGDISVARSGTLNAVGVKNDKGNRVNVDFKCITFELDELLGMPVKPLRKTLVPKLDPNAAQPANDVTYLDEITRVIRGGDGAIFIFQREDSGIPMLTIAEREVLLQGRNTVGDVVVGIGSGKTEGSTQPEIKFLFKENEK